MFPRSKNSSEESLIANKGRLLPMLNIQPGETTLSTQYPSNEIALYACSGEGIAWIKHLDIEYMCALEYGSSLCLPKGASVQFRNSSDAQPLQLNIFVPENTSAKSVTSSDACSSWQSENYPTPPNDIYVALPKKPDYTAPDGSQVSSLVSASFGNINQFSLPAKSTSTAVQHSIVEEIWTIQSGQGEIWMKQGNEETIIPLTAGVSFSIPIRTAFQFRSSNEIDQELKAIAITMPPWPGAQVIIFKEGPWTPTIRTPETNNPLHSMLENKLQRQLTECRSSVFQRPSASATLQEAASNQLNNDGTNCGASKEAGENISSTARGSTVSETPTAKLA